MKNFRLLIAAPLLALAACATTPESLNRFAVGLCEGGPGCTVRDQRPRHGPPHQRAVDDVLHGRADPM